MNKRLAAIVTFAIIVALGFRLGGSSSDSADQLVLNPDPLLAEHLTSGLSVDYSASSVDLDQILNGGPGKDGIPSIDNPKFVGFGDQEIAGQTNVIVVEGDSEQRVYPYSILVWHEVVNDTIDGNAIAVTFCPLCGAAIVYERDLGSGQVVEFGVSGLLYESNLLMYSREGSETLWSQSLGEAIAGSRTGEKLTHYPFDLMTYEEARRKFPSAKVLSEDTGHARDYKSTPYAGYSATEELIFPVAVNDKRYPAKEIFYIVPLQGNSIAVRRTLKDGIYDVPSTDIKIYVEGGDIEARWGGAVMPGYFEMWFSWATHHQENSVIIDG